MAEHGAHLTSVHVEKPSIFELIAQENLHRLIKASLEYLTKKCANPLGLHHLANYSDTCILLFEILIQYCCLKQHGGSLSEHFYGLQRIPSGDLTKLSNRKYLESLATLCLFPRIKDWLDREFENLQDTDMLHRSEQVWSERLKSIYVYIYPCFHLFCQLLKISYQMSYLLGYSFYHSPELHLTRICLMTNEMASMSNFKAGEIEHLRNVPVLARLLRKLKQGLVYGLTNGLPLAIFFIQYLDWWQNTNRKLHVQYSIPPPLKKPYGTSFNKGKCLICFSNCVNDTALATSGFVFCYKCIYKYIKENQVCPVTKYQTTLDQLVRLYPL